MKSNENPLYIKYLSLFENPSTALISSTKRDNDTGNVIWRKLAYQFAVGLSNKIKINSQTIFDQINKERELFIAAAKLTYYSIIALKDNDQWVYDSGPIALSLLLYHEGVTGQILLAPSEFRDRLTKYCFINKNIFATGRAVHECLIHWIMTISNFNAGMRCRQ